MKNSFFIYNNVVYIVIKRNIRSDLIALIDLKNFKEVQNTFSSIYASYNKKTRSYYAKGVIGKKSSYLHRFITKCPDDLMVDHNNHDTLDNREFNLKNVNNTENQRNRYRPNKTNKTGVRGLCWITRKQMWRVQFVDKNDNKRKSKHFIDFQEAKNYAEEKLNYKLA